MRYLILLAFIYLNPSICLNAQKDINLGEVSYDSLFNCNDSLRRRPNERLFGIPNICDSKNDIEIRLNGFSRPGSTREFIIFSYKDGKWDAKKYINSVGMLGRKQTVISFPFLPYDGASVDPICTYILNRLIENKIFLVPDQSKTILEGYLMHGMFLTLSYKTKDLFRSYSFSHPVSYLQEHPDSKEYIYLKEIIKTLQEIFD